MLFLVRVLEELYNNSALDLLTILVMLSSFHGMNIPTLLHELSADFDSKIVHEMYEDASPASKHICSNSEFTGGGGGDRICVRID